MSSSFVANVKSFYSVISLLDVKILLITESLPDPLVMTKDWLVQTIGISTIESISIVLFSDPRSFFFSEFLFQIPSFSGIVLCTDAVYRLGRLFIKEIQILTANNTTVLPVNLDITPLTFYQPYSYGDITFIPHPNGTGIGNCNWLITKGNDPELVSFSAFIVTGLCVNPLIYTPPSAPSFLDIVCFLPSAVSPRDYLDYLDQLSRKIIEKLKDKMKVVIPSFIDDSLYAIMHFLRYKKSFSNHFFVYSFVFERMLEILNAMPNSTELAEINEVFITELNKETHMEYSSIYFAPYPTMKFGQIIDIMQFHNDTQTHIQEIYSYNKNEGFTMNSGWPKPLHFFDAAKEANTKLMILTPIEKIINGNNSNANSSTISIAEYTKECTLNDDLYRWIEKQDKKAIYQKIGSMTVIGGEIEGERVVLQDMHQQTILNLSTINDFGLKLIEIGAANVRKVENTIQCNFPFIEGDNEVSIEFEGENITIITGSVTIEDAIFSMIHLNETSTQ